MSAELTILVPVLRRPHRVRPLLESAAAATPGARVLFLADPGDKDELAAIRREQRRHDLVVEREICGGTYARKINRGVGLTDEPLVFLGADDIHFHPGWLRAAVAELKWRFAPAANVPVGEPYGGSEWVSGAPPENEGAVEAIGVVGTRDLCNKSTETGELSTHSLVTRWYCELGTIDEPGKVLHEGYRHEFVDAEFVETARHRGMYSHAREAVVEHCHPDAGKAPMDALYAARSPRMRQGRKVYRRRRHLWT